MLTGNFVLNQVDLRVKGRGGFDAVFARWYNSSATTDSGLGLGWTHSFNHALKLYGVEGGRAKVGWVNGSGGESFFSTANLSGAGPSWGTTLTASPGVWSSLSRSATDGNYILREQDGTTYVFDQLCTDNKCKLRSITDRNGNTLNLYYVTIYTGCAPGCTAAVPKDPKSAASTTATPSPNTGITDPTATETSAIDSVTDSLGRTLLKFTWDANRIHMTRVQDYTGRGVGYAYTDGNNNLTQVTDARSKVHGFSYYASSDGPKRDHRLKRLTHPKGNGLELEYYSNGQVFRHTAIDTSGNPMPDSSTTFEYNPFTRESVSINERGYRRSYLFDSNGNPVNITDENGAATTYTYDPANPFNRASETDSIGRTTRYTYERANLVATVTPPSGAVVELRDYNTFAKPQRSKDAIGNWNWMGYDARGNLTDRITLAAGVTPTAGSSPAAGNIKAWTKQTFDAYGNPVTTTRVKDFSAGTGPSLTLNYDTNALNVLSVTRQGNRSGTAVNETTSPAFTYDTLNRPTGGVDARWYRTTASFDEEDHPLTATDALGQLRSFKYDDNGNLRYQELVIDSKLVDSRTITYDDRDRVLNQADAGANVTAFNYDGVGNLVLATSPDGYSTSVVYDAANRPVATFDEAGNRTYTQLDTQGRSLSVTDPNGNAASYSYWAGSGANFGRLRRITAPAIQGQQGRAVEFSYDAAGRSVLNRRIAADGASTRDSFSFYDELGRLARGVGESDNTGQRLQTCARFDTLSNLTEVWAGPTTDTSSAACNFSDGNLKRQLTQTSDDFGQLLTRTDALAKTWSYSYDYNGNLATSQSPEQAKISTGTKTTYGYTTLLDGGVNGLLKTRTVPAKAGLSTTSSYTYTPLGQPLTEQILDNAGSVSTDYGYRYDTAHRLSSVADGRGQSVVYDWTPGGRLSSVQLKSVYNAPTASHRWDYKYDNLGRLSLIVPPNGQNIGFSYDAAGRLLERTVARAATSASSADASSSASNSLLRSAYAWLADGSLASLTHLADSTPLASSSYDFDTWGNRWHLARSFSTADQNFTETLTHGYDSLDRLTSVSASTSPWITPNETYGYDLLGNRTSRSRSTASGATSWSYQHDAAQRLTGYSQTAGGNTAQALLRYDDNGNLLAQCDGGFGGSASDTSTAILADCTASGASSQVTRMTWNGLEQLLRVAQSYAGTALPTEAYSYDASGRRIAKVRSGNLGVNAVAGTLTTHYLYGGSDILGEWSSLSSANNFSGMPKAVYTHAGTDAPVLRSADSMEGGAGSSGLPTGASQVYAQDGLGSVIAMLDAPAPVNLAQQPQNVLSSTGSGANTTNPTQLLIDGDISNLYGKTWGGSSTGASATLTLASPTMVDRIELTGPTNWDFGRPTQGRVEVRDANGVWSQVALQALSYDAGNWAQIGFTAARAYAVRVTLSGSSEQLGQSFEVGELRIFSAASLPGNYAATQSFDAWGNVVQSLDGVPTYGYTGREPDATGLMYYRARYYSPALGRFISRDPIGLAGGINPYSYVGNDPVNLVDPSGLLANKVINAISDYWGGTGSFAPTSADSGTFGSAARDTGRAVYNAALGPFQLSSSLFLPTEVSGFFAQMRKTYDTPSFGGTMELLSPVAAFSAISRIGASSSAGVSFAESAAEPFSVADRVAELRSSIPQAQQGRITMAVGVAEDASGGRQVLISTSEPRGYLRPGVVLNPGESVVAGIGHAEADLVTFAAGSGLRLLEVGATRPICAACASALENAGARAVTKLKKP